MDYRYKVFICVAENLSISKAANELYISQPAVSKHIMELESQLGIALFERRGNKIILTKAGKLVYDYSRKTQQLQSDMEFALGKITGKYKGILRIGASSTIAQYVLPSVLASFHKKYIDVELNLYNGNSVEMESLLKDNKIDIALVENQSSSSNLRYSSFLKDEIVLIIGAGNKISQKDYFDIEEIYSYPIIFRERGSGTLEVIESFLKNEKIDINKLKVLLYLGSTEAIKNFLPEFEGIAFVSKRAVIKDADLNLIRIIPLKGKKITRDFRIALTGSPDNILTKTFLLFLKHYNF